MDDIIIISNLNDFIFCPASIYFHKLYGSQDNLTYQSSYQINVWLFYMPNDYYI